MAQTWYYSENGQNSEPYDEAGIGALLESGAIKPETMVWNEQLGDWKPAAETELSKYIKRGAGNKLEERSSLLPTAACSICQKNFNKSDMVDIDGRMACSECKPQMLRQMQEGVAQSGFYHYGGFWIRVVAAIVDGIILWVLQLPVAMIIGVITGVEAASREADGGNAPIFTASFIALQSINVIISIIVPLVYSVVFVSWKGATPGKMAVGIRIINADGSEKISVPKAIGRHFAKMLSGFIFGIGYLMVAFDDEKRGLHDRMCKTRVIYKNK